MPVLRASGEAEALCAQLNSKGLVDACITADSDAFLFGAKCVIKHVDLKSTVMPLPIQAFTYSINDSSCMVYSLYRLFFTIASALSY